VVGAVNGVSSLPLRIRRAEALIAGRELTTEAIDAMSALAYEEADPVSDLKAPDWYKKRMVRVICRRALQDAWRRSTARP
jgi:carbon-monoxide dehydrogenase medium subunit